MMAMKEWKTGNGHETVFIFIFHFKQMKNSNTDKKRDTVLERDQYHHLVGANLLVIS